jgi:hypothetical protein
MSRKKNPMNDASTDPKLNTLWWMFAVLVIFAFVPWEILAGKFPP